MKTVINIINTIGNGLWVIFNLSFLVGCALLILYVSANAFSNSRSFTMKSPKIKRMTYSAIDFSHTWGPNLLVFYFAGRMLIRLLTFLMNL